MAQIDHLVDARAEEIVGGGAGEHHGTKLPEIKADALSEREKLYAGMKKISSKINGLRINQGRLLHRLTHKTLDLPANTLEDRFGHVLRKVL